MKVRFTIALVLALAVTGNAWAQRVWLLDVDSRDGPPNWTEEATGGCGPADGCDDGIPNNDAFEGKYWWYASSGDLNQAKAWYKFEKNHRCLGPADIPAEPRLYQVETFVPAAHSGTTSIIEVRMDGKDANGSFFWSRNTPWDGVGTNRQWLKRNHVNTTGGQFAPTGAGPQAPTGISCGAGNNGLYVWLKRGSALNVQRGEGGNSSAGIGVSVIRITELMADVVECDPATYGGAVDLRCVGNADPLAGVGDNLSSSGDNDRFGNGHEKMISQNDGTLGAEGYIRPCSDSHQPTPSPTPLSPGLPPNGAYTVHDGSVNIPFKLRYDGWNTIKWDGGDNNPASRFYKGKVFTLNQTAGQQFFAGPYGKLHLLTVKSDGNRGELVVEAVYSDTSTETFIFKLFDWFNTDGDATSKAVGVNGELRGNGPTVNGFKRLYHRDEYVESPPGTYTLNKSVEENGGGGNHGGAFLFLHSADLNNNKSLSQIRLSIRPDERSPDIGGGVNVVAMYLDNSLCQDPVFDVAGGGVNGDEPDGAVDMKDFGFFQACFTGPAPPPGPGAFNALLCSCYDVDANNVIDDSDWNIFQDCWTGPAPAVPVNPDCDD